MRTPAAMQPLDFEYIRYQEPDVPDDGYPVTICADDVSLVKLTWYIAVTFPRVYIFIISFFK